MRLFQGLKTDLSLLYLHSAQRERDHMIKVVSLDVGGTLIDDHYGNYVWNVEIPQLYASKRGINFEEARDYVLREYNRIGSNDIRWFQPEYWFKHLNLDGDPLEIFRNHVDKVRFYPEVSTVLATLCQKYELIIASGGLTNIIDLIVKRFRHYFKHIFASLDRQERKTPQFYKRICKILRINPETIAHVGDDWESDFIAPRSIGIKSFYLDRTGTKSGKFILKDLRELKDRLFKLF